MQKLLRPALYLLLIVGVLALLHAMQPEAPEPSVQRLSATDARMKLAEGEDVIVVDVRTPGEQAGAHGYIAESVLIPLQELRSRVSELDAYGDHELILVCRTHNRSAEAAEILRNAGFERVSVMHGGMLAWREAGYPVEADE